MSLVVVFLAAETALAADSIDEARLNRLGCPTLPAAAMAIAAAQKKFAKNDSDSRAETTLSFFGQLFITDFM